MLKIKNVQQLAVACVVALLLAMTGCGAPVAGERVGAVAAAEQATNPSPEAVTAILEPAVTQPKAAPTAKPEKSAVKPPVISAPGETGEEIAAKPMPQPAVEEVKPAVSANCIAELGFTMEDMSVTKYAIARMPVEGEVGLAVRRGPSGSYPVDTMMPRSDDVMSLIISNIPVGRVLGDGTTVEERLRQLTGDLLARSIEEAYEGVRFAGLPDSARVYVDGTTVVVKNLPLEMGLDDAAICGILPQVVKLK